MRALRFYLNGFVLSFVNIASISIGFGVYRSLGSVNQIAVQAPVAALLSVLCFVVWSLYTQRSPLKNIMLRTKGEFAWAYFSSLLWNPVIFVPFHFLTQGYLTSVGNLIALWLFQLPVNLLAIIAAHILTRAVPA
jgi:hypothetical protein